MDKTMTFIINQPKFDRQWRAASHVCHGTPAILQPMVDAHYLHKWPAVRRCLLTMYHQDLPVGMVIFAEAPRSSSKRYGGVTWELARLWLDDCVPFNGETWLIAQALRHLKQVHAEVQFIVSYADPSVGHCGTIYKASNWKKDGRTDDDRKTPRMDLVDTYTGIRYSRWGHAPKTNTIIKVPRVSKYRYVFPMDAVH
jgi:hypothetical protein